MNIHVVGQIDVDSLASRRMTSYNMHRRPMAISGVEEMSQPPASWIVTKGAQSPVALNSEPGGQQT